MKISESWLREWVQPALATSELVEQITMAGLEVDSVEPVAGVFSGVVVGEIVEIAQHPDADKLRVCKVAGHGDELAQVVCGAPNARVGIKIPFATIGAELPPGDDGKAFKIKKAKLRGVESFGMLCAQTELQAGDDDDGLWELPQDAPVGTDLRDYLSLNDQIIEVDLTPNRSDCLSVRGIAREVGVLNRLDVCAPVISEQPVTIDVVKSVQLVAAEACPRYVGRVIKGVDISQPSPLWMQEKLRRSGLRSIDAVVDVTNYVLLELGQPMHAFDLSKLNGDIQVRMAAEGELLTLLDDQEIKLKADTLVIADESGPLAMAGIMGGAASAVTASTVDIFLESAFFAPLAIAGKARNYGLHTDSSHRFERGVDFQLQEQALERATELLLSIVGGSAGPVVRAESTENLPQIAPVTLRKTRIESGLGFAMSDADVEGIITRLGLTVVASDDTSWTFAVPSYRFDIEIEEDLLEELARVYGYNNLPTTKMKMALPIERHEEAKLPIHAVQQQLIARGYQETVSYSFIEPKLQQAFNPDITPVSLQNPISADMAVMRTSLWPSLVSTLQNNLNRQQSRVRLFETGQKFVPGPAGLTQEPVLGGLVYGSRFPENWAETAEKADFFDVKADVESLLALTNNEAAWAFSADSVAALHPGQTAAILLNGEKVGIIGALHPQLQQTLGINQPVYLFEVSLASLQQGKIPNFSGISRFPAVRRDIAVIVDKTVSIGDLFQQVRENAGSYLEDLKVFDVYVGKGIDTYRKSVALGLTFQHPSRTLNEDEINAFMASVVSSLEAKCNATLR